MTTKINLKTKLKKTITKKDKKINKQVPKDKIHLHLKIEVHV